MPILSQKIITPLFLIFFLSVFLYSTGPVTEGDLFWHIKTGEWIWSHKAIPSEDIFTYTFQKEDPLRPGYLRQELILKGSWLSQVILYKVYDWTGILGIIVFRALLILLILLSLYWIMRRWGTGYLLALVFLFLSGLWFMNTGDRPHLFSFLLFPWVLYFINKLREEGTLRSSAGLILLMALWPNLHGGYVIGLAVMGIYLLGFFIRLRDRAQRQWRYPLTLFLSCLATGLNPNTYKTPIGVLQEITGGVQARYVAEMASPFLAFKEGYYYPHFWLVLFITLLVIIIRFRQIPFERLSIILLFIITSLMHQRMIPFFFLSIPFIAPETERAIPQKGSFLFKVTGLVLSLILFISNLFYPSGRVFSSGISLLYPVTCAVFLNEAKPEGRLFNWSDWGGYLMVYSPQYRLFSDGRRLMDDVEIAHDNIWNGKREPLIKGIPLWRSYIDAYKIDIILIPPVHPLFGQFGGLVRELYLDRDFSLVYAGQNCLVYLRKDSNPSNRALLERYGLPKELAIIKAIKGLHNYRTEEERRTKKRLIAELYRLIGKEETARQYEDLP